jgi:hypothetical protein
VTHKHEREVQRQFVERTRLGSVHKFFLYGSVGMLWLTGLIWILFHYFGRRQGDFGDMPMPIEPLMMKIHGAAAMLILLAVGAMSSAHIRRGWVLNRNRPSGALVTSVCAILLVTGWMLYYVASERSRDFVSAAHWIIGLALPLLIYVHILLWKWEQNRA